MTAGPAVPRGVAGPRFASFSTAGSAVTRRAAGPRFVSFSAAVCGGRWGDGLTFTFLEARGGLRAFTGVFP